MASLSPLHASAPSAPGTLAPQHFHPPTPRELRAQAIHRLQIGLLGLGAMLLLVMLANVIMDRARVSDAAEARISAESTAAAMPEPPAETPASDPLADIGVVPDLPSEKDMATGIPPAPPPAPAASAATR